MPQVFVKFAQSTLDEVANEFLELKGSSIIQELKQRKTGDEVLCRIDIDTSIMWQQLDRRVDEYVFLLSL